MNKLDYKLVDINLEDTLYRQLLMPSNKIIQLISSYYGCHIICHNNHLFVADLSVKQLDSLSFLISQLNVVAKENDNIDSATILSLLSDKNSHSSTNWQTHLLTYTFTGKPIYCKTYNQYKMQQLINENIITFVTGEAGTGKTFLAIIMAAKALRAGEISKIILCRPAVEAGENLGFLPGDLKEKINPYLMPLYDFLETLLGNKQLQNYLDKNIIEILPLAYMRGRSLNDAYIILDEAQNTSDRQMLMFLSRLGSNSKIIVTGDIRQIDINIKKENNGLIKAIAKLKDIPQIAILHFTINDVVRHPLIGEILKKFSD